MFFLTKESDENIKEVTEKTKDFIFETEWIASIIIIIAALILGVFLKRMVYRFVTIFASEENKKRTNKLLRSYCNVIGTVMQYLVYIMAFFAVLVVNGVQITTMLASAGFIGVLITYLFQDLIKDITNGFFIVFSSPFEVGDMVKIDSFVGKVKEITSRYVVLLDAEGNRCIINNRRIDAVVILTREIKFKK